MKLHRTGTHTSSLPVGSRSRAADAVCYRTPCPQYRPPRYSPPFLRTRPAEGMVALLRAGEHHSRFRLYSHALHANSSETVATAEPSIMPTTITITVPTSTTSYKPGVQQPTLTPPSWLQSPTHDTYEKKQKKTAQSPSVLARSSQP